ncbi:MAG: TCP-1/cpn60 chaperonin family protein [Anaeroplasmataceae bacterium]
MFSNEISEGSINLVKHETLANIVDNVLTDVSSVKTTLGPGGKTNLVHDSSNASLYQSKDGYRIVMNMHYDDYFYDAIAKLIKDVSAYNNSIIGDGTTSAVVILNEFYKMLNSEVNNRSDGFEHISLTGVTNILSAMKDVIRDTLLNKGYVKFLKDYTIEEQKEIICKVATIAANNDNTIGKYVAKIFDKIINEGKFNELFVDIVANYSNDTSETNEIGFRMNHSFIDRIYTTEPDKNTAIHHNPKFLLIEGAITDKELEAIKPLVIWNCLEKQRPLVIIAGDYTQAVTQWLYSMRIGGSKIKIPVPNGNGKTEEYILPPLDVLAIQLHAADDESHEKYVDLETALGGRAIPAITETWDALGTSPEEWEIILGESEKIICIPFETSIIGGCGDVEAINARVAKLQEELDHMVMISDGGAGELRKAVYRERIGILNSNMVSIRVGGLSFKERQYNCLVYEDAICAVKSTIKNGFTLAGQVSLKHVVEHHADEIVSLVVDKLASEGRNVTFGAKRGEALKSAIRKILKVISETCTKAYETAITNAIFDEKEIKEIKETIYNKELTSPLSYNLMNATYEGIDLNSKCNMLVAGNTDYETFAAIISITNLFLNTDKLETIYIPKRISPEEAARLKREAEQH